MNKYILCFTLLMQALPILAMEKNKCDINTKLLRAIKKENVAKIQKILGKYPEHEMMSHDDLANYGDTGLMEAIKVNNPYLVKLLLDHGAYPSHKHQHCTRPLNLAACLGNIEIVRLLLLAGADPNATGEYDKTPLHDGWMHKDVIKLLFNFKAKPDLQDKGGRTPLHLACEYDDEYKIIKTLIAQGASLSLTNKDSQRPLDVAKACRCSRIIQVLEEAEERAKK